MASQAYEKTHNEYKKTKEIKDLIDKLYICRSENIDTEYDDIMRHIFIIEGVIRESIINCRDINGDLGKLITHLRSIDMILISCFHYKADLEIIITRLLKIEEKKRYKEPNEIKE